MQDSIRNQLPPLAHSQRDRYAVTGYAELESGQFIVRRLQPHDDHYHDEYQRLRASIFVHKFGWNIPVDEYGRERDIYDLKMPPDMSIHCVFLNTDGQEHLVSGVRIRTFSNWDETMTFTEFHQAGMIPDLVLKSLQLKYQPDTMLELTRLCVRNTINQGGKSTRVDAFAARDYTYATVYALVEHTNRPYALAIVDRLYWHAIRRAKFTYTSIYTNFEDQGKDGYALIVIDLVRSISAMRKAGDDERVRRMLALSYAPYFS